MKPLDEDDLRKLKEGFGRGASVEELKLAKDVLAQLGYERVSERLPARRVSGRKPGSSTNSTDTETRLRIGFLRLILGECTSKLSEERLLSVLLKVISTYNGKCSLGLFLEPGERTRIQKINEKNQDVVEQVFRTLGVESIPTLDEHFIPTEKNVIVWLKDLSDSVEEAITISWSKIIEEATTNACAKSDKAKIYADIKIELGLEIGGFNISEIEKQIATLEKLPPKEQGAEIALQRLKTQHWRKLLHSKKSYNLTLQAATSRLILIRNIVDSCSFVPTQSEDLHRFLRLITQYSDSGIVLPAVEELDTIFKEAIKRQGRSPFLPMFNEEVDPGPEIIPEDGQMKPSPPLK